MTVFLASKSFRRTSTRAESIHPVADPPRIGRPILFEPSNYDLPALPVGYPFPTPSPTRCRVVRSIECAPAPPATDSIPELQRWKCIYSASTSAQRRYRTRVGQLLCNTWRFATSEHPRRRAYQSCPREPDEAGTGAPVEQLSGRDEAYGIEFLQEQARSLRAGRFGVPRLAMDFKGGGEEPAECGLWRN